jgi:antibiotic biosynthesis monooxygenase (ABM) superfamily enzyme
MPVPPAVDAAKAAQMMDRIDRLEGAVRRLRETASSCSAPQKEIEEPPLPIGGAALEVRRSIEDVKHDRDLKDYLHLSDAAKSNLPVTGMAHHHIKWEREDDFIHWCGEFRHVISKFPGFVSLITLHGKDDGLAYMLEYVVIWKFRSLQEMQGWNESTERLKFLERLKPMLESPSQIVFEDERVLLDAFSELFVNPGEGAPARPPPLWKTFTLVMIGLMMCVWPINENFEPVLVEWGITNLLAKSFILPFINVGLNSWLCVPLMIFLFGGWLHRPRPCLSQQSCLGRWMDGGFPKDFTFLGFDMWIHVLATLANFGILVALSIVQPVLLQ